MARIGILGGTFDPPHTAHVAMARTALAKIPLHKVLFTTAPQPPHKDTRTLNAYKIRRAMVEAAIRGEEGMEVSLLEEFRAGPSYTVDLLRHYKKTSADGLYLIMGADTVADLPNWREPESILKLATLVVFPRAGYSQVVPVDGDAAVVLFEEPVIDISSTEIRDKCRAGEPIAEHVPATVRQFILDNSLYS